MQHNAENVIEFCETHQTDAHIEHGIKFLYDVNDERTKRFLETYLRWRKARRGYDPGVLSEYQDRGTSSPHTKLGPDRVKQLFSKCAHGLEYAVGDCTDDDCRKKSSARGFILRRLK